MPAVTKTMLVSLPKSEVSSSKLSMAAFLPTSGNEPAPTSCQRRSQLNLARHGADVKRLSVRVADNEVYASDALLKHGVDRV